MRRLYNIDTLKFLCAVLVVFLHVRTSYQTYILPLTRCAVPCFLIISGYLIYTEDRLKMEGHLKKSIYRMLRILVWSSLLFAMVKFLFALRSGDFSFLSIMALGKFVLFNENPFGFHLWYIGAYLYTLAIVLFFVKCNRLKYIWWSVPFLLLLDLCLGKYSLILWHKEFPYIWVRNFLCVGIPYFSIGMVLKQWKWLMQNLCCLQKLALGGVILFSLTSIVENRWLLELHANAVRDHYISTTFLAVSLFLLFLSLTQHRGNALSMIGEKESLYIYIFHPLFMVFFSKANQYLPDLWLEIYRYGAPVIILIATILLAKSLRILHIIK